MAFNSFIHQPHLLALMETTWQRPRSGTDHGLNEIAVFEQPRLYRRASLKQLHRQAIKDTLLTMA